MSNKVGRKATSRPKQPSGPSSSKRTGLVAVPPMSVGSSVVFPASLKKTFTTSDEFDLTMGGFSIVERYSLSLNSLFDPDYSGTGIVPRYYATLLGADNGTTPYSRYQVVGARLRLIFSNGGSTNAALGDVGVYVRNENTNPIDTSNELYMSEYTVAKPIGSGYASTGTVIMAYEITAPLIAKLLNCNDLANWPDNVGNYNSDPTVEVLADIYYRAWSTGSTNSIHVRWVLEQDAILTRFQDVQVGAVLEKPQRLRERQRWLNALMLTGPTKRVEECHKVVPAGRSANEPPGANCAPPNHECKCACGRTH